MYFSGSAEPEAWPHKEINMGLDLQGGMHLVLEVESDKAVENTVDRKIYEIRKSLRQKQIKPRSIKRIDGTAILSLKLSGKETTDKFKSILKEDFQDMHIVSQSDGVDVTEFRLALLDDEAERIKKFATDQALETIRNRIDDFGVSEPDIRKQGENRILIQLPGITDTKNAKTFAQIFDLRHRQNL